MMEAHTKYGPHTPMVEEVVRFALSDRVLSAVGPAEETEAAWIVTDLKLAWDITSGEDIGRFELVPDFDLAGWGSTDVLGHNLATGDDLEVEDIREELTWIWPDLTENLVAELIKTAEYWERPDRKPLDAALSRAFRPVERKLLERFEAILPPSGPAPEWWQPASLLANNIACELRWCADNRAFNGPTDNFWERLFGVYRDGLWPCGWRGVYPHPGKFVAFRFAEVPRG